MIIGITGRTLFKKGEGAIMDAFCTNCGTKIFDSFNFCPSCGTPVAKQEESHQKEDYSVSNEFMKYEISENGEEVFYLNCLTKNGTVQLDFAKGNGARLCKNGIGAMELLKKDGYIFKNAEMPMLLSAKLDINDPDCEVLSVDVIAKLYKANTFLGILGYDLQWKELPAILGVSFSDFFHLKLVDILVMVMKNKMDMDLPLEDKDKIRIGESLLLCESYDGALEWFKDYIDVVNSLCCRYFTLARCH